jgi:hypothetical protein
MKRRRRRKVRSLLLLLQRRMQQRWRSRLLSRLCGWRLLPGTWEWRWKNSVIFVEMEKFVGLKMVLSRKPACGRPCVKGQLCVSFDVTVRGPKAPAYWSVYITLGLTDLRKVYFCFLPCVAPWCVRAGDDLRLSTLLLQCYTSISQLNWAKKLFSTFANLSNCFLSSPIWRTRI